MTGPLKLRAVDADDLAVLAACLQDALVPVHDMQFLADERRFVLVANRFRWETLGGSVRGEGAAVDRGAGAYERVHCGISFENVTRVQTQGFSPAAAEDHGRLLEVLTLLADGDAVTLLFAGGAALRLAVDGIEVLVQDLGEPWPTLWRPRHPVEDELE